ncbi:MAG: hypothetical protein Q9173_004710 [Seirophora scorigena]
MKRKLGQNNVPTSVVSSSRSQIAPSFKSFGLDSRLLQATVREGFNAPTIVQSRATPLALEGKDILVRARTGSGKTAAYLLPLLELVLRRKKAEPASTGPSALILLPTHELAQQTSKVVAAFTAFCRKDIRVVDLTQKVPDSVQRSLLADSPDLVIATPGRAALSISTSAFPIDSLSFLVIDEADLVLSYGYEDDLQKVAQSIPSGVQTMLVSATLTTEVDTIKTLYCRDPVILDIDDHDESKADVTQYVVKCAEDEKFLLAFVIFKLKLIKGKSLVFIADIDRCYRLKLFLEQFGVKCCVLNSELPVNSRFHVVEQFNKNVYDIIIASDESEVLGGEEQSGTADDNPTPRPSQHQRVDASDAVGEVSTTAKQVDTHLDEPVFAADRSRKHKKMRRAAKNSKDYGISRGIDFKDVACVLNFDLPTTSKSYTHRIGRTARAGRPGMALSFVVPASQYLKHKPTSTPSAQHDEIVLAKIVRHQGKNGKDVKPYDFDMKQVEAFKYRVNDALRAITPIAIREARTQELRQEMLKSEKLKRHFEENPADLEHLMHDGALRPARVQAHLKHIPDYLMPSNGRRGLSSGDVGFVGFRKTSENRIRKARMAKRMAGKGKKPQSRRPDPLKTFDAKGRR